MKTEKVTVKDYAAVVAYVALWVLLIAGGLAVFAGFWALTVFVYVQLGPFGAIAVAGAMIWLGYVIARGGGMNVSNWKGWTQRR